MDYVIVGFGLVLVVGGVIAVRRKRTTTDYGESVGGKAVALGYFWIVLGLVGILGVLFDVKILKKLIGVILGAE